MAIALYSTPIMSRSPRNSASLSASSHIPPQTARYIDAALTAWFAEHQRDLNFRKTRDPYAIMVAELMLQQTTAATVQGYFPRFMGRFPTVSALAAASESDVLTLWAGLGYYRRARQLHAAAKAIMEHHAGQMPRSPEELIKLPGIGRYTAGAIASAAYDFPAPILETNTVRVFSRLAGIDGTIGESAFMKQLWQVSEICVHHASSPRTFNTAAMELGSLVCRPQPRCEECPVNQHCTAFAAGIATQIPRQAPSRERVDVSLFGYIFSSTHGQYLLRKIPAGEWHAGLWEFPTIRLDSPEANPTKVAENLLTKLNLPTAVSTSPTHFKDITYQVTHHKVRLRVWQLAIPELHRLQDNDETMQFLSLSDISALPMGSAQKKVLIALEETESACHP